MRKIFYWLMSLLGIMTFNLQAFAENLQTTSSDGLTAEMKQFYDMTLIDEAGPNLIHEQFGQKRPIPKNGGKTIEFRKFDPLPKATQALTEGVTPDGKNLTVKKITADVLQYGDYITQTDVLELTALDNTILEATKLLGRQAGATLDTVVRNVLLETGNVTYCPKVENGVETEILLMDDLTEGCQLTVDVVMQVVAKLRAQNAPTINGKYVAIIHPYVAYGLMRDPEWVGAHKYADPESLYEGEIGELAGVRFVQTTEAKITKIGDHGIFTTLFMGADAYGITEIDGGGLEIIVKQKGSGGTSDPLSQRSSCGWKAMRTAEILVENYLVRVDSYSNRFSKCAQEN